MNLSIRMADQQHIPIIRELANKIWKAHYASIITEEQINYVMNTIYASESIKQQMSEGHVFRIVYLDEIPIGYISLSNKDGENYFLNKFYIQVDEHGKGIGSKVFQHILDELKHAHSIELTVNRQNFKAVNFYFKMGFVIKAIADVEIGEGYFMNDFIMVKKLKQHVA